MPKVVDKIERYIAYLKEDQEALLLDLEMLSKQRDRAIADVKKLREVLKAVRDCDVPLENDSVPFIGLRELAEYILKSTNHYND